MFQINDILIIDNLTPEVENNISNYDVAILDSCGESEDLDNFQD